jgi:hypothetical protein
MTCRSSTPDVFAVEDAIGMRDEKLKQREFTSCDVDAHCLR